MTEVEFEFEEFEKLLDILNKNLIPYEIITNPQSHDLEKYKILKIGQEEIQYKETFFY